MSAAEGATDGTLSGALELLTGSVRDLQSELEKELSGKDISSFRAPETLTQAYADAQATQQALVDAGMSGRKRKEMEDASDAIKSWAKAPGESLVDGDVAPFLAYNEEHFRHVNPADVANLVPQGPTKLEDDLDFRIPALGRYYVLGASPRARALLVGNPRVFFRSPRRSCRSLSILASAHRRRNPTPDLPSSQSGRKRTPWKLSARARGRLAALPRRRSADATPLPPPQTQGTRQTPRKKIRGEETRGRRRRRASCRPSPPRKPGRITRDVPCLLGRRLLRR